jgi:hypothetical protein
VPSRSAGLGHSGFDVSDGGIREVGIWHSL